MAFIEGPVTPQTKEEFYFVEIRDPGSDWWGGRTEHNNSTAASEHVQWLITENGDEPENVRLLHAVLYVEELTPALPKDHSL